MARRAALHLHERARRHGGCAAHLGLAAALRACNACIQREDEPYGGGCVERVLDRVRVKPKGLCRGEHASRNDARRASRGGSHDHAHGSAALEHRHRAGDGFGLDGSHEGGGEGAGCALHSLGLSTDEPSERAPRALKGLGGLGVHDLDDAAHNCAGLVYSDERFLAAAHDAADGLLRAVVALAAGKQLGCVGECAARVFRFGRTNRSGHADEGGHAHVLVCAELAEQPFQSLALRKLVELEDGVGRSAPLGAVGAHEGDVHVVLGQANRERCKHAGRVAMGDEDGVVLARDIDFDPAHARKAHAAAAKAFSSHRADAPAGILHLDIYGVGMQALVIGAGNELEGEAALARELEGIADALVVCGKSQDACHERTVGAVSAVRVREAVVQHEAHANNGRFHKRCRHLRTAQGTSGVRGGGPHHDGA